MSFIECRGAVHFFERRSPARGGAGPTLVFVNGLGTDHRIWDGVWEVLPRELGLLRFDQRGHGASEAGEGPYSVEGLSGDLWELLERLAPGPLVACGLSLGGLVVQRLALERHPRVKAVCLCATAARIADPEFWAARARLVEHEGLARLAESLMPRWFGERFRREHPEIVRGHQTLLARTAAAGYEASIAALAAADHRGQVGQIELPTLVVSGGQDVATPPALGLELSAQIKGARFELLPEAGHLLCVEEPQALARLLMSFLGEAGLV